jgi:hypothetical protein
MISKEEKMHAQKACGAYIRCEKKNFASSVVAKGMFEPLDASYGSSIYRL